jgi:hypothetical protein
MASSGKIEKLFSGGFTLITEWSEVQNIANNYGDVICNHKLKCASGYGLYIGARSNSCIAGGISKTFKSAAISTAGNTTITLGSTTHKVEHEADGSKKISISTTFYLKATLAGKYVESVTVSGTITLNTIPRESTATCNSFYIGDSTTITINRASPNFTHTLKYAFGSLAGTIVANTGETTVGWTPPNTFHSQIPNATSGNGTVTCETYNKDVLIGTTVANYTAYVRQDQNQPTVTATVVDTNASTIAVTGDSSIIVKELSKPKVTVTATPKNSATIKQTRIYFGDGSVGTNATTTFSNGVVSPKMTVSATDSRNLTGQTTYDLTTSSKWVEYVKLSIKSSKIARTESTSNTCVLTVNGNYHNGSIGKTANTLTAKFRYKETGGTFGSWTTLTPTKSGNTYTISRTINDIDYQKQYEFEVQVEDKLIIANTGTIIVSKGVGVWRVGNGYVKAFGDIYDQYHTKITNGLAQYESSGIDPNTTKEELLLTSVNTPTTAFWYVRTMFFKEKSTVARKTQVAYPYAYDAQWVEKRIFTRVYIETTGWTAWKAIGEETTTSANYVGQSLVGSNLSIEWATVVITPSAANVPTPQRVYFNKTYEKAPIVLPVALTASPGINMKGVSIVGITTGYASISVTSAITAATTVHFAVIGKAV